MTPIAARCGNGAPKTTTVYEYSEVGQRVKRSTYNRNGELEKEVRFDYNAAGQRVKQTQRWLMVTSGTWRTEYFTYTYDAQGHKIQRECRAEKGLLLSCDVYTYDARGNKIKAYAYNDGCPVFQFNAL